MNAKAIAWSCVVGLAAVLFLLLVESGSAMAAPRPSGQQQPIDPALMETSIFGLGYAGAKPPGLAAIWAKTGVRSIKLANVQWQFLEPRPPNKKGHVYRWNLLDRIIEEFQYHGFNIQPELKSKSRWGSKPLQNKLLDIRGAGIASTFPKRDRIADFEAFIEAVVERYDGDGVDDMPGLRAPILYYEIESEAQHEATWQGTAEEYTRMLRIGRKAALKANPNVKIILAGINLGDIFDDFPTPGVVAQRFGEIVKAKRRDREFIDATLKADDAYDIVEFHYNRDYTGIYGTVAHIRKFTKKTIWAGDATSAPYLQALPGIDFNPFCPRERGKELYEKIVGSDRETVAWFRAEQARLTAKKFICAAEMGLKKVMMQFTAPWKAKAGVGTFHQNFFVMNMVAQDLSPLPVYYTIKTLVDKIEGFTEVERLDLGNKGFYAYRFRVGGKPVYALWFEDGRRRLPGEKEGSRQVELDVGSGQALVTGIVTALDQTQPRAQVMPTRKGKLSLLVTETPVFVEPR